MDAYVVRHPRPSAEPAPDSAASPPGEEHRAKRIKIENPSPGKEISISQNVIDKATDLEEDLIDDDNPGDEVQDGRRAHHCTIEDALPAIAEDKEAIQEYQAPKDLASEISSEPEMRNETKDGMGWSRGRRSIYVDAFNLALDTVLQDESHLFDDKEHSVFNHWRQLSYECQYLYVRLFLRKTSAWHRQGRLGYYGDISNLETAIKPLQELRPLPAPLAPTCEQSSVEGIRLEESDLGDEFAFADASRAHVKTIEEAASLLSLDELKALAKVDRFQGKNKAELVKALCRVSYQQPSLTLVSLRQSVGSGSHPGKENMPPFTLARQDSNRTEHFVEKILAMTGPCIRVNPVIYKLFERVHLVFYRSTEWTTKSLTTIILAKISRRIFVDYIVCRTANIFESRRHLLEYEAAIQLEAEVDSILEFNGPPGKEGFQKIMEIHDRIYHRWKSLVEEEQRKEIKLYEHGEGGYLRRFTPAHSYTRIIHKATYVMGRLKQHSREHATLSELLDQRLFHPARRGTWYQRKALLEEHYMYALDTTTAASASKDVELKKKHWKQIAITTCEKGLQDNDCHLIYHYDLQKRLVKLEKQLRVSFRERHDFGHTRLAEPEQHTIEGVQLKRLNAIGKNGKQASTKTAWLDLLADGGHAECSVEEMCLTSYRSQGWKGYHAEGGIIRTLFAYLFFDILFLYIPNVFQTAFQTCPLDLHTDVFYPARASEINQRLAEIANGGAERIIREVNAREREKRTCVVGLNWDYDAEDLVELVGCFNGNALATVCKVMAQEYRQRGGGIPDLILWKTEPTRECMFAEVKSANDRLSDTQRLWIHVLTGAGVKVALCNAIAREVRMID